MLIVVLVFRYLNVSTNISKDMYLQTWPTSLLAILKPVEHYGGAVPSSHWWGSGQPA